MTINLAVSTDDDAPTCRQCGDTGFVMLGGRDERCTCRFRPHPLPALQAAGHAWVANLYPLTAVTPPAPQDNNEPAPF